MTERDLAREHPRDRNAERRERERRSHAVRHLVVGREEHRRQHHANERRDAEGAHREAPLQIRAHPRRERTNRRRGLPRRSARCRFRAPRSNALQRNRDQDRDREHEQPVTGAGRMEQHELISDAERERRRRRADDAAESREHGGGDREHQHDRSGRSLKVEPHDGDREDAADRGEDRRDDPHRGPHRRGRHAEGLRAFGILAERQRRSACDTGTAERRAPRWGR